jgi:hypothetical protein
MRLLPRDSPNARAKWIALLPLMKPTTGDTEYFGGIDIILCTSSTNR